MMNKKSIFTGSVFIAVLVIALAFVACNNSDDDKKVAPVETVSPAPIDTVQKMDTATTRPVKPAN